MVLPAHILLPPPREVSRPGEPGPVRLPPGSLVVGRVLGAPGGVPSHTPDGAAGIRVQFPQGTVLIPTTDRVEVATQLFAQVREEEGRTLLSLLDGAQRGSLFQGRATVAAPAGGETMMLLDGEPTPVTTATEVRANEPMLVQLQPRGSRAVLQHLPARLSTGMPAEGVVRSTEGPQLTVVVAGVEVLARAESAVTPGSVVHVRVAQSPAGPEVVASPAPAPAGTAAADQALPAAAALRTMGLPASPAFETALAALEQAGMTPITAPLVEATAALQAGGLPVTAESVAAAQVLLQAGAPVSEAAVRAAQALLQAGIAVTPESLQAVQPFLEAGAPISAPAIAAAMALMEISVAPEPAPAQALAHVLYSPPTLGEDLGAVRDAIAAAARALSPEPQAVFLEVARGLTNMLLDMGGGRVEAQMAHLARFGGLHTEQLLGALETATRGAGTPPTEAAVHPAAIPAADAATPPARGTAATADAGALPAAASAAARDARVLLGRILTVLRQLGPDAPIAPELRAVIEDGAGRLIDRMQGLQLQNLRAPVVEHLTLELPIAEGGEFRSVQLKVFYREDRAGRRAHIDERNTTLALLLDTSRLGHVNTTLTIVDGRVNTDFRVDTPEVADYLVDGAEELTTALGELGYEVGRVGATARRVAAKLDTTPSEPEAHLGPDGIDVRA